jgi:hypothetical protein
LFPSDLTTPDLRPNGLDLSPPLGKEGSWGCDLVRCFVFFCVFAALREIKLEKEPYKKNLPLLRGFIIEKMVLTLPGHTDSGRLKKSSC